MSIKISHESPLCSLEASRSYNDYDYALVHLFEKYPEYYNFFKRSLLYNREVLLDNSIFELGTAFDSDEYAKWIEKLLPTYYIVPDALEDTAKTIDNYMNFVEKYKLPGLKIGAVQGKDYTNIVECYKFMSSCADYIAISFDFSYYQHVGYGTTKYQRMASGRQHLIASLIQDNIWDWSKPVHLLGCSLPQELKFYRDKNIYNIRSVDTSNPIMAGINGMKYAGDLGLQDKPKGLLADNLEINLDTDQLDLIKYNLSCFRSMVN